jgi:hypothetical protein
VYAGKESDVKDLIMADKSKTRENKGDAVIQE